MGLFSRTPDPQSPRAREEAATQNMLAARDIRARAAQLKTDDARSTFPDPSAVKEITDRMETDARIRDANARQ